jgi:hypothetical protein
MRMKLCAVVVAAMAAACGGTPMPVDPPTEPAVNTVPFAGGVYFVGYWHDELGVQRFWPTRATNYYAGPQPFANTWFFFRPSDGQLFYGFTDYGVFVDDSATAPDSMVPTPPCAPIPGVGGLLSGNFQLPVGFDGQNRLHYYCSGFYRDGELITGPPPGFFYVGVLGDGRMVVQISDPDGTNGRFAAMAPDGSILSDLDPGLQQPYELLSESITVQGNDAFVLVASIGYDSLMSPCRTELIAYRLDPQSNWLRMRSIPIRCGDSYTQRLLSDGTVLMWKPDSPPSVTALLPDGTKRVAWRLTDSPGAGVSSFATMVVGPREPTSPSMRPE